MDEYNIKFEGREYHVLGQCFKRGDSLPSSYELENGWDIIFPPSKEIVTIEKNMALQFQNYCSIPHLMLNPIPHNVIVTIGEDKIPSYVRRNIASLKRDNFYVITTYCKPQLLKPIIDQEDLDDYSIYDEMLSPVIRQSVLMYNRDIHTESIKFGIIYDANNKKVSLFSDSLYKDDFQPPYSLANYKHKEASPPYITIMMAVKYLFLTQQEYEDGVKSFTLNGIYEKMYKLLESRYKNMKFSARSFIPYDFSEVSLPLSKHLTDRNTYFNIACTYPCDYLWAYALLYVGVNIFANNGIINSTRSTHFLVKNIGEERLKRYLQEGENAKLMLIVSGNNKKVHELVFECDPRPKDVKLRSYLQAYERNKSESLLREIKSLS